MNKKIDADFKEMLDEEESVRFDSNKFTQLRNSQNLSQSEVAKKVDLSLATINRLEKGHVEPKAKDLVRFAQEFGVSLDWLLDIEVRYPMSMQKISRQTIDHEQVPIPYIMKKKDVARVLEERSTEFLFQNPDTQYSYRNPVVFNAQYRYNLGISTRNLICYRISTDFGFPYIMKNDMVMVDITPINFLVHKKMIVDEGSLYAFSDSDSQTSMSPTGLVHRVIENCLVVDGGIRERKELILRRLNRMDTPFELISEEEATKKCLGRIIYRAGRMFTEKEKRYLPNF